jgi:hypothetical protein
MAMNGIESNKLWSATLTKVRKYATAFKLTVLVAWRSKSGSGDPNTSSTIRSTLFAMMLTCMGHCSMIAFKISRVTFTYLHRKVKVSKIDLLACLP